MKKKTVKLRLNRETLRALELREARGAAYQDPVIGKEPLGKTNEISICIYCTTPLDGCPVYT